MEETHEGRGPPGWTRRVWELRPRPVASLWETWGSPPPRGPPENGQAVITSHLAKAMVFPVVMYGCESWTIKKAEG